MVLPDSLSSYPAGPRPVLSSISNEAGASQSKPAPVAQLVRARASESGSSTVPSHQRGGPKCGPKGRARDRIRLPSRSIRDISRHSYGVADLHHYWEMRHVSPLTPLTPLAPLGQSRTRTAITCVGRTRRTCVNGRADAATLRPFVHPTVHLSDCSTRAAVGSCTSAAQDTGPHWATVGRRAS